MTDQPLRLFVARHGQTDYNARRLMQGRSIDAPLNALGRSQGTRLAERFRGETLDAVYTSVLQRAKETAAMVAEPHGLGVTTQERLCEMAWGRLEGQSIDDVADELRRHAEEWRAGRYGEQVGGAETIADVRDRAAAFLEDLVSAHRPGEQVLVVAHGRFMRVLLSTALLGGDLTHMDDYQHSNTGVYQLDHDGVAWHLKVANCTRHLEPVTSADA